MSLASHFKEAMASWATGVSVVATRAGGLEHGVTVSSFTSLSLAPPLVLVCLNLKSAILPMVAEAGGFSVSVLASDQQGVSGHFASAGRTPEASVAHFEAEPRSGLPLVRGALAWVACKTHARLEQGDHAILIGEVTAAGAASERAPLVYHRRGYHGLGPKP